MLDNIFLSPWSSIKRATLELRALMWAHHNNKVVGLLKKQQQSSGPDKACMQARPQHPPGLIRHS
jgi:hypothetical protein